MTQLSVYKASAGSGKTFRLTVEYLKIVIANPANYRKILAITFTNKATAEMKSRILEQLHELVKGEATAYLSILAEELGYSVDEIQERAKKAEQYILHDYSRFSVMTIDAFFQSILKAFAKELGVSYNYNVELDTERIKRLAVERMFSELDDNKVLRGWLRSYVEEKIGEGRSWNITRDILTLSQELFQEEFFLMDKNKLTQWSDKAFVNQFAKGLQGYISSYEKKLQEIGRDAIHLIEKEGLTVDDFKWKSGGVAGFFAKLAGGQPLLEMTNRVINAIDDSNAWYSKTNSVDVIARIEAIFPELNEKLKEAHQFITEKGAVYQSCLSVKKNLYMMGIFSDIARHIYEVLNNEEKILLSESNKLLYEMIAENEVPFIYEKTGSHYLYFLWDEFQDTSQIQWHNLKPLLANALAEGQPCLIVGDIKQAIYRWRNSDWRIMDTQVEAEFSAVNSVSMQQNWRSDARIISFNNLLYAALPKLLEQSLGEKDKIASLYKDVEQFYPKADGKENGFVHFSYLPPLEEYSDAELVLNELPYWVETVQEKGVKPEDIVFLVRKNSEAVAIADFFAKLEQRKEGINYNVVSEYALLLENSFVVKVIVNALYYFHTQEKYYEVFLEQLMPYLADGENQLKTWKEFVSSNQYTLSVISLVQKVIRTFSLHTLGAEQLYLMAFEEFVSVYMQKQNGNLSDFLLAWEDKKGTLSVTPGERMSAMRVMTVHKAKGLEFNTVIMPFSYKNLESLRQGETFWQETAVAPLDGVGPLLVPFVKKELLRSNFAAAYQEEMYKRYVDELNVFYVGTTRAVNNLIIIAPEKTTTKGTPDGVRLTNLLYEILSRPEYNVYWEKSEDGTLRNWNYGELKSPQSKEKIFGENYEQDKLYYQDFLKKFPLRVSAVDAAKREDVDKLTPTEDGKIWHRLLEEVRYIEDIPLAIKKAYYSGLITINAVSSYTKHLKELLQRNTIREYFTDKYEVLNERPVWANGETYIPDRVVFKDKEVVVIDYKFGEAQHTSHKKQVEKYLVFFERKGFKKLKGYLIYGVFSEIIEV